MKDKMKISILGVIRYTALLICVCGLWWFFRSYLLFLMMGTVLGLGVVSPLILWKQRSSLQTRVVFHTGCVGKDREIPMEILVENHSRILSFPVELEYMVENVFTEYQSRGNVRLWSRPGSMTALQRILVSHHVGRLQGRVVSCRVYDWLHLCSFSSVKCREGGVLVKPMPAQILEEEITSSVEGFPLDNETKKRGIDINPDYEIREYIPGDDLKNIHWKLTAKQGKTMVRERLANGRDKVNVLVPLSGEEKENDGLMEALAGLCQLFLEKGYPIRLCWQSRGEKLNAKFLAEQGELENAIEEILSGSGKKNPGQAVSAMETEYPGEAYVIIRNGTFKGTYVGQN